MLQLLPAPSMEDPTLMPQRTASTGRSGSPVAAVVFLVTACLMLSWSTAARADDWPAHGLDPAHGSATHERSGPDFRGGTWSFQIPNGAWNTSSPAIADGIAVVGSRDGTVYGLRAGTGQLLWKFAATDGVMASPAIHKGRVFVPSLDRSLYALRLTDGKLIWKKSIGGIAQSSPQVVADSLILAGGYPLRQIFRIDAATGATLWATRPDAMAQFSNSVPVIDGDQVLVGAMEGHLYSFDLATGALRWTYDGDGMINLSAPVIAGSRAYLLPGGASGRMHAVELATGKSAEGWPVDVAVAADEGVDTAAARLGRSYAVSSVTEVAGRLVFDVRVDDAIDTDKDKVADQLLLRETVMAVEPGSGQVVWQRANGRLQLGSANDVPKNWLCPTPVAFAGVRAAGAWVAVASSVQPSVQVLDARSGQRRGPTLTLTAPGRTSPVLANGRLFVESEDGRLESHLSSVNQPPDTPVWSGGSGRLLAAGRPLVEWKPVLDPDGDDVAYEIRIDRDGEILESWLGAETTAAGATSLRLSTALEPGVTYVAALRARDARGAWSEWSKPQYLRAVAPATGHLPVPELSRYDRVASMEHPAIGSIIRLGVGTFRLQGSMDVPAGVSLEGAGPGKTVLDATGLEVGLSVGPSPAGTAAGRPTEVRNLTVVGAKVGIAIGHDVHDVRIRNVIVRGSTDTGVAVGANAVASLVNLTLAANGRAVRASGRALVKNSIVVGNQVGLAVETGGAIASAFNDLTGNLVAAYQGMSAGESDLAQEVAFVGYAQGDLHVQRGQPTTDRGDPGDAVAAEPAPSGGRINLGAFGGTSEAELSAALSSPVVAEGPTGVVVAADPAPADGKPAGEGCAVAGPDRPSPTGASAESRRGGGRTGWLLVGLGGVRACLRRRGRRSR